MSLREFVKETLIKKIAQGRITSVGRKIKLPGDKINTITKGVTPVNKGVGRKIDKIKNVPKSTIKPKAINKPIKIK